MYGGQPPLQSHQIQHAPQTFDSPGAVAPTSSSELQVDSHVPALPAIPPGMTASHFNNLPYPFQGIPDPSALMSLSDQPNATHQSSYSTDNFPQHATAMTSAHGALDSIAAMSVPRASFDAGSDGGLPSLDASDDGRDPKSPGMGDSLEDSVADEFELTGGRADGTDLGGKGKDSKANGPPAWTELKTKAGKDRKRLPLACIACRRKKIRCSGEKPACKHCLRSRIPCVYKATTRKAAPRTDYMAMLDKRLKRMEERIIKVIPKSDQSGTSTVTRAVVKPAIPGMLQGAKSSKKRGAEEAFGPGLEAWAKAPSKAKGMAQDDGTSPKPDAPEDDENQLFQEGTEALPSKDIQEHLAEVYFDHVYGQAYLLLHKPSYMRKLKSNSLPPVLVLSVCAVAARFSANPKLQSSTKQFLRGENWASCARDICTKRYETPNITILTCVLILGLHEFGTCQGARSWALGGQATRMAFALQLHKDLDHNPHGRNIQSDSLSFVDKEIRRRIMWACFVMDRFNSSGSDRPMFIKDDTIEISLPIKERLFQLDMPAVAETLDGRTPDTAVLTDDVGSARENMGVAAYLIRAIALWGRIMAYVNEGGKKTESFPIWNQSSGFAQLSQRADEAFSSLPAGLHYTPENLMLHNNENTVNQFLLLHLTMQQNVLFLSRLALHPSNQMPSDFLATAMTKSSDSANHISDYLREAESSRYSVTAPFAGYCAFSSTTVLIGAFASGDSSSKGPADANIATNIRFLRKLTKYWGMFHWMEEDIRTQYRNAVDRVRSGTPAEDQTSVPTMLQYGDWFDKYPHGISDAEFMDPASQKKKEKGADGVLEQKPDLQSVEDFFTSLSPRTIEKREVTRAATKRETASKKQSGGSTRKASRQQQQQSKQQQPQPESLHIDTSVRPVHEQNPPPQQAQRRQSMPMSAQSTGPPSFSQVTAPHSQASAYASVTPISPINVNHFGHPQQGQAGIFSPDMLTMNMQPQSAGIMQPLDHQLNYGGYSLNPGHVSAGPQMMAGLNDWEVGAPNATMHGHGFMNGQHHQGQGHQGQPMANGVPNGMNGHGADPSAEWFQMYGMEDSTIDNHMGLRQGNTQTFNGIFGNNEMGAPNSLGGLRHAP